MPALEILPLEEQLIRSFLDVEPHEAPSITVHSRHFTGAGLYTEFSTPARLRPFRVPELPAGPRYGPVIESAEIPNGAGSLLWAHESGIHKLEVFTYTDPVPEGLRQFQIHERT